MKPLALSMQAFGPYAAVQTLNFDALEGRQFFLIHGPTGAGKTTILDAVCFALYGASSGAEREGSAMRSDHADPATPTEVTFDFAVGQQAYRVRRRPKQERPKKRGGGTTTDEPQAALWRWTLEADGKRRMDLLAGQWDRCTRAVEDILGFRSAEFRQVVMLPQGQFRQLLAADSRERQKILETLFHTEQYRMMEERLREKAKDIENDVKDFRRRIDLVLAQASAESTPALTAGKQELEAAVKDREESLIRARREEVLAQTAVHEGVRIVEKIEECAAAKKGLQSLESQKAAFAEKRRILEAGRLALILTDAEAALESRRQEHGALTKAVDDAGAQLLKAGDDAGRAEEALRREQERETQREAALRALNELTSFRGRVADLDQARNALKKAQTAFQLRERQQRKARETLAAVRKILEEKTAIQTQTAALAAQEPALSAAQGEARKLFQGRRQYEEAQNTRAAVQKKYAAAAARRQSAEQAAAKHHEDLRTAEHLRQEGRAAVLARTLTHGEPCPVCGSREHPSPAVSDASIPEEQTMRELRAQLEKEEQDLTVLREKEVSSGLELERCKADLALLRAALGDAAELPLPQLEDREAAAEKALALAREAGQQAEQAAREMESLGAKEVDGIRAVEEAEQACQAAFIEKEKQTAVVSEREASIPEAWRDAGALKRELTQVSAVLEALKVAFREAQEKNLRAREARSAAEATLKEKTAALKAAAETLRLAGEDFAGRLVVAGFSDEASFQSAKRRAEDIGRLDEEIRAFEGAVESAGDRMRRAVQAAEGLAAPDLEGLSARLLAVKDRLGALTAEQADRRARVKLLDAALRHIADYSARLEDLEARYAVFGRISEVAGGKNLYGMTFQRFVLAALLDDVLTATSARLKIMSRERYELHRVRDRSKRPSGLELEVYDAYTGALRGVATLSGGESFLASLSLALGLADVVQSYAGGVHLDTIFIDEGFGSLDPEALEQAMVALMDLQKGGRLVGVISHVPEMKEWIPARLEITSGRQGSEARFVLK
ncbi:MAG: SMC family ATPase [Deltaproteobacteria bacterium]|nr:SMC family ATPase [Deltaproteobacteria bacterium]